MKELCVKEMEEIIGGSIRWGCVGAGVGAVAIIADPFAIFAIGEEEGILIAGCLAGY